MIVNDKLEGMWKEEVGICFKTLSQLCLEGLRKTTKNHNVGGFRIEIRTRDAQNMEQRFKLLHRDVY
jgi:hypothetical protein